MGKNLAKLSNPGVRVGLRIPANVTSDSGPVNVTAAHEMALRGQILMAAVTMG
jgi:hypothetical protein